MFGIPTLTYDYRGIGLSKPKHLRGFQASIEDWSEFDCSAAIDWLHQRSMAKQVFGVGHSVGSLLFCGAPNVGRLSGLVMIGPHTGYYGDYQLLLRAPMAVLWHIAMPIIASLVGYFPAKALGLGDDIPKGIAMQWARRRMAPSNLLNDQGLAKGRAQRMFEQFSRVELPALMLTIADDAFATTAGAARVRQMLPKLHFVHRFISLAEARQNRIGHFGFFRRVSSSTLWPIVLRHLQISSTPTQSS